MFRITTLLLCLLPLTLAGCPSPQNNPEKTGDNPPITPAEHPQLSGAEKAAVADIERLVGSHLSVGTDGEPDLIIDQAGHVIVVDLSGVEDPQKVNDAVLEYVGKLTHTQKLFLSSTAVTDSGLAHLAGLSELTHLDLSSTAVTNAGLRHLKSLKNLRTVYCLNTQINTAGSNDLKKALPKVLVTHGGDGPAIP